MDEGFHVAWKGHCPICGDTTFESPHRWFRDYLRCVSCGSVPRERALTRVLKEISPNWRELTLHESSPADIGASRLFAKECPGYTATQFFPGAELGSLINGVRCENLEKQTFPDETFDIVITQDVMEHVFNPDLAYKEVWRTLKNGGAYIHTFPIHKNLIKSIRRASIDDNGAIRHLVSPSFHLNPISEHGSLVTWDYGYDIGDLIASWAPFDVEIRRFNSHSEGIVAEFSEVIICRKRSSFSK